MAKLKPLGSRVLVKRSSSSQSKGKILIPDSAQEKPSEGIIVRCGVEINASKCPSECSCIELQEGDRILFSSYVGPEIQFHGEDFLLVSLKDILGVLPS